MYLLSRSVICLITFLVCIYIALCSAVQQGHTFLRPGTKNSFAQTFPIQLLGNQRYCLRISGLQPDVIFHLFCFVLKSKVSGTASETGDQIRRSQTHIDLKNYLYCQCFPNDGLVGLFIQYLQQAFLKLILMSAPKRSFPYT